MLAPGLQASELRLRQRRLRGFMDERDALCNVQRPLAFQGAHNSRRTEGRRGQDLAGHCRGCRGQRGNRICRRPGKQRSEPLKWKWALRGQLRQHHGTLQRGRNPCSDSKLARGKRKLPRRLGTQDRLKGRGLERRCHTCSAASQGKQAFGWLSRLGRRGREINRRLDSGLTSWGHEDSFKRPLPEPRALRDKRIFPCGETREPVASVLLRNSASLSASRYVAQHNCSAVERN